MAVFSSEFPDSLTSDTRKGQNYMLIESYESVTATTTKGKGPKLSSIALYIPAGSLNTSFTGNYEGVAGSELKAQASGEMSSYEARKGLGGKMKTLENLLGLTSTALQTQVANFADQTGFVKASGLAPNNHISLLYNGPNNFREHTFAFKFFPKSEKESNKARDIIDELKHSTLPRLPVGGSTLSSAFFKAPRNHTIKFCSPSQNSEKNPYLFEIGKSVITNMIVNYDPQGVVGFHDNGAPVSIDLSLTFKEIEMQISKDGISATRRAKFTTETQGQASAINPQVDTVADRRTGFFDFE
jgi:hypothetical protein